MRNKVKILTLTLLVAMVACLAGCSEPTDEELLVGHWTLTSAQETVSATPGGVEVHALEGYEGQTMDLFADYTCFRVDRGDTLRCQWYLASGRQLLLADGTLVMEDYQIDDLSDEHLALSHAYIYHDSVAGARVQCLYQFEYQKNKDYYGQI